MSLKFIRNLSIILALLILSLGLGFYLGSKSVPYESIKTSATFLGKEPKDRLVTVDFSLFWDVWDRLNKRYIDKDALDPQKMIYGAISGMVSALEDPYTVFLPPEKNKEVKDDLGGKFEGIGAQLGVKDKKIVVVAPLKGTPAEASGIKAGDWIIKVDGKETANWTLPEAVSKIRGPRGSNVVLTVLHKGEEKSADITVTRDTIKIASVEWELNNVTCQMSNAKCEIVETPCGNCSKIIYLKLGRFGDETSLDWNRAVNEIVKAIESSSNQAIKGLILDLRNNPGGYLSGSVFIASEFLEKDPVVIQEYANERRETFNVERQGKLLTIPMVVLINKGSASASEIVAGALKAHNRARLIGETSFGKGSIQEAQELPDGSGIHITTAKWLLPNGEWINDKGVTPDVIIEDGEGEDEDLQLDKAVEILLQ